jgi:hypothetical protein
MLAPFLGAFFALKAGIGIAVIPIIIAGLGPLLVLIISLYRKNTYWQLTLFDFICGMFALIALIFYIITRNTALAIFFIILSDGLAAIPTLLKSWRFPETETGILYLTGMINNIIGLLILKDWSFSTYSLGIYFIIVNTLLVFFIYRRKIFKTQELVH